MPAELVFKNGPWNSFFEGQSGEHQIQLLFDDESTVLSLIWDIKNNEAVGVVLELMRIFVCYQNPGVLIEKSDLDCLQIAKKEGGQTHWFVLIHSLPTYVALEQSKIDSEMDRAASTLQDAQTRLLSLANTLGVVLQKLESTSDKQKSVFFSAPIIHEALFHKAAQEKIQLDQPQPFMRQELVSQGEFIAGLDTQQQLVKEPLGLFRRTLITDGQTADRIHAMHVLIESALLSTMPVVVFDAHDFFDGLQFANTSRDQLERAKISLEPVGFPIASFSMPEKIRIDLATLDIEAMLELFRAGKTPAIQVIQKILSNGQASNLTQLVEVIAVQAPVGATSTYQLKKAVRLIWLIEKNYPGFFDGPSNIREIAKSWGSGLGRAGLIHLDGLDKRIKLILLHSLLRELKDYYKNLPEQRPVKAVLFLPEAQFLFPRHGQWKIYQLLSNDLQQASAAGLASVISTEHAIELNNRIVAETQTQISIVNQDDIGIRIENRKPYRAILRPALSQFGEIKPVAETTEASKTSDAPLENQADSEATN